MRQITTFFLALSTIIFFGCSPDKQPGETQQPDPDIPVMTTGTNQSNAGSTAGVQHYVCPNSCEGSGGTIAGSCPTCGSEYQHNALYHSADNNSPTPPVQDYSQLDKSPLFKDAQPNQSQTTIQTTTDAAGNVAGVQHYTCPNSCAGSGGETAGVCSTCGSEYQHNAAYHANNQNTTTTTTNPAQLESASSAQNATGEYHYTCTNGCAGGAAASGNCAHCGAGLAHNAAFHQ